MPSRVFFTALYCRAVSSNRAMNSGLVGTRPARRSACKVRTHRPKSSPYASNAPSSSGEVAIRD